MKVFTAQQMRDFDRAATEEYGIPSIVLMENAALRVVEFLEWKFAPIQGKRAGIVCGKGNNGGDGFAIARHLSNAGCGITVLLACRPDELNGDALANYQMLQAAMRGMGRPGMGHYDVIQIEGNEETRFGHRNYDFLIDALLGTGFKGPVRDERISAALNCLTKNVVPKVAVDIPSALDADIGEAAHGAVRADYTVTFVGPKRGMFQKDGLSLCGEIWIGDIGTSLRQWFTDADTNCQCMTRGDEVLLDRPLDAHKGSAGRVAIIGGSFGMSGAPTLAARAALRVGAGTCVVGVPEKVLLAVASGITEATTQPLPCDENGKLIETAANELPQLWESANVVAIGPGIGREKSTLELVRRVVRECPKPLVIDADALYALRAIADDVKTRQAATILTPHPGEMGELMEMSAKDVQNDRIGVAAACEQKYGAVVVLKGARSIVALPPGERGIQRSDAETFINLTGNAGMATGGSGDVLTGTIAGLLAQTRDAASATLLGVYLHGLAGDLVYAEKGNGLIAGDIAEALPRALLELAQSKPTQISPRLWKLE